MFAPYARQQAENADFPQLIFSVVPEMVHFAAWRALKQRSAEMQRKCDGAALHMTDDERQRRRGTQ